MSTARFDTLRDAAGNNPSTALQIQQGRAKAWLNLNGTGTIATRDSFNVSSVTDNGAGDYSIFPTTPFANADYVNHVTVSFAGVGSIVGGSPPVSGVCRIYTALITTAAQTDYPYIYYSAVGDQ